MGAARRLCVRAVVLAGMLSAIVSLALPGCQFPGYGFASETGGSAGAAEGGTGNGVAGTTGDGGTGGDGAEGGDDAAGAAGMKPEQPACDVQACVPRPPAEWIGPIAFWEGAAAASLPACPQDYAEPMDLHHTLIVPTGGCACTCKATGQNCQENTSLVIFSDRMCADPCATVSPDSCTPVSGCIGSQGSVRAAIPTPSGGSCIPTVSKPPAATWQNNARLCEATEASACEDPNQVCAPTPRPPYLSQLCVMRLIGEGEQAPDCPAAYPKSQEPLYSSISDSRDCTPCTCGGVTGGSCTGKVVVSSAGDCSPNVDYTLGAPCKWFDLGGGPVHPATVSGQYMLTDGTCSVATPSQPNGGTAKPEGNVTIVCCK